MPLLSAPVGAFLFSVITIIYGIFFEKFYVSRSSMIFNAIDWVVIASTLNISIVQVIIMVIYAMVGWAFARIDDPEDWVTGLFQLFGSKAYGSLALALTFTQIGWSSPFLWLADHNSFLSTNIFLIIWLIIAIVAFVIGAIVSHEEIELRL